MKKIPFEVALYMQRNTDDDITKLFGTDRLLQLEKEVGKSPDETWRAFILRQRGRRDCEYCGAEIPRRSACQCQIAQFWWPYRTDTYKARLARERARREYFQLVDGRSREGYIVTHGDVLELVRRYKPGK